MKLKWAWIRPGTLILTYKLIKPRYWIQMDDTSGRSGCKWAPWKQPLGVDPEVDMSTLIERIEGRQRNAPRPIRSTSKTCLGIDIWLKGWTAKERFSATRNSLRGPSLSDFLFMYLQLFFWQGTLLKSKICNKKRDTKVKCNLSSQWTIITFMANFWQCLLFN